MLLKRSSASFSFSLYVVLVILSINTVFAQDTSNKGTDFWVAYAGHKDGTDTRLTLFITSEFNATVTINAGGVLLPKVSLTAHQAKAIVVDPTIYKVYVGSSEVVETKKGIHVTSDKAIIVYSHISYAVRSAATLVFPTKVLGTDYYSINYKQVSRNFSQFTIVGVEDGTQVEIVPSKNSRSGAHKAGVPFTIKLNKGDIYQFQSLTDLSGSRIHSLNICQPIAVFSGSTFTAYCENTNSSEYGSGSGDNLYQQLLPVSAWGRNFISAPFYNTLHGSTDIYRIIVATDKTTITVNGSTTNANGTALSNPYSKGTVLTFNSKIANVISADKPISVTQLQTSQGCSINNAYKSGKTYPGDPEMTVLSPIEQTLKEATVYSAVSNAQAVTNITSHFINIIIKTADASSLRIDGSSFAATEFKAINSQYSYLIDNVTKSSASNPTHRITASGGFVAIAYGYGDFESYGYLAGSDLRNLNQYIEVRDTKNNQLVKDGCVGVPYRYVLKLPYIASNLNWDLGNGVALSSPSPVYTADGLGNYSYECVSAYARSGNYNLKVHAVPAIAACKASPDIDLDFAVYKLPAAKFSSPDEATVNTTLSFTDQSEGQGKKITRWQWDFGDNTSSTVKNPVHTFKKAGDYTVKLIALTESGCNSAVFDKLIKVNDAPASLIPKPVAVTPKPAPPIIAAIPKGMPEKITPKPAGNGKAYTSMEIWDSDAMDYDSVSITLNGKQIGPKSIGLQLYERYGSPAFTWSLDLQPGDNTLEITALNEGLSPNNTFGILLIADEKRQQLFYKLKAKQSVVIHVFK